MNARDIIRNTVAGLLCAMGGIGLWSVATYTLLWEKPWPFVVGLAYAILLAFVWSHVFDAEEQD